MVAVGFGLKMEVKKLFFDREVVAAQIGKVNARALSRIGSFIRKSARSSMRSGGKKGKSSAPGSPPRYHKQEPNLRTILFAFDRHNQSLVVGPIRLNQKHFSGSVLVSGLVPPTHEFGGEMGIREKLENLAPQIAKQRSKGRKSSRPLSPKQKSAMIARKIAQGLPAQAYIPGKKWIPIGKRKPLPGQPTRTRVANYPARPFMGPALQKETTNPKLQGAWAQVSGASLVGSS